MFVPSDRTFEGPRLPDGDFAVRAVAS